MRAAAFSGVEILAYCVISNHFHLLVYVPDVDAISDETLFHRLRQLYTGSRMDELQKQWDRFVSDGDEQYKEEFRQRYIRRMWDVSEFMKTLKQYSLMSYNARHNHSGTMWESRFRVKEYQPDDKMTLMKVAGYIDRNPLKAGMVTWPDQYEWCSFSAACKGDMRAISGYRYIYSAYSDDTTWQDVKELHEISIHLVYKELTDEKQNALDIQRQFGHVIQEKSNFQSINIDSEKLLKSIPCIVERGSNKLVIELLRILKAGKKSPSDLRKALNIASPRFFTTYYLSVLEEKGLIQIADGCNRFSPKKLFEITGEGEKILNELGDLELINGRG